jgi:hypothetical protein
MNHRGVRHPVAPILMSLLIVLFAAGAAQAGWRLMGSVGARAYGYEDAHEVDHLWLIQNTSLSLIQGGGPLSVHVSGNYLGDNEDEFSESGTARLTRGYIQYGRIGQKVVAKAGRFFMARGVALGVFDGVDAQYQVNPLVRVSLFGGLLGPLNRHFELADPEQGVSYGGEVMLTPAECFMPLAKSGMAKVSYVKTEREEGVLRHLVGLQTYHKFPHHITWLNTLQIRPSDFGLRKFISRGRMMAGRINAMAEVGLVGFDTPEYSWFSEFSGGTRTRTRIALDYFLIPHEWALGAEVQMLLTGSSGGFRGGPVVTSPWGKAGYRLSAQDQGQTSGPWVSLHYRASECLTAYFSWQQVTYEWDAFDIESEDLTSMVYGGRFTPKFAKFLTASLQVQVYTTPQLEYDQRMLGGLEWRFDTGRTAR